MNDLTKKRRDLKPDAQGFDKIIIETIPRYKQSELSGDEWRISASTKFYRKGKLVHETGSSNIYYAAILCGSHIINAQDNGMGFFAGERDICDQEGCEERATILAQKKFDWCKDGHKSETPSNAYRLFCSRHAKRGDCGLDDSDLNYEKVQYIGSINNESI